MNFRFHPSRPRSSRFPARRTPWTRDLTVARRVMLASAEASDVSGAMIAMTGGRPIP